MLKPLLRTIPTLSGNISLSCRLNDIIKDSQNDYHAYVRVANMVPLQNSMFDKKIELNLLNGKYEYDVARFYKIYSNVFYNENFAYNKKNYALLDLDSTYASSNDARNKDYELGCKRIKYGSSGYQFNFYAPIYIDNSKDIPYCFVLKIRFNDSMEKTIKIIINDSDKTNYLGAYLRRYVSQIDDRVIFCLTDSLQATYFGIDVKNGGLVQYKDNEIGALYINQTTINNFDYTICKGFSRNKLMMSQIIPLSFTFNINDFLTKYEQEFFMGTKMTVYGYYCSDDNTDYPFYDFDIDYSDPYYRYLKYDEETGKYSYLFGKDSNGNDIEVMNSGWPALNESKYIKYAYTNKITPKYCKFKMMLSSDYDPYITNLNFGYTSIQTPNQKYGYFPTMFKGIYPQAYVENKDLKLPIGNNKETYYKTQKYYANDVQINTTNIDKYIKLMSNYAGSWYSINSNFGEGIFDNDSMWTDVKYNYAYYKGILYNLRELSKYNIDKFGVMLNANVNYVDENNALTKITRAKVVLSKTDESPYKINGYNDSYVMKNDATDLTFYGKIYDLSSPFLKDAYILTDKSMIQDKKGKYVEEKMYNEENTYYRYDELINIIMQHVPNETVINELDAKKIRGYLLLDGANNKNFFETYEEGGEIKYRFMLSNELFGSNNTNHRWQWLKESLYYSDDRYTFRKQVSELYEMIGHDSDVYGKFAILQEMNFIHVNDLYNILIDNEVSNAKTVLMHISNITKYNYNQYGTENDLVIKDYFTKAKNDYTEIYVDPFNMNELIDSYNKTAKSSKKVNRITSIDKTSPMMIRIISKDHLKEYVRKLNRDENNYSALEFRSLLNSLYVKQRAWIIDEKTIYPKDIYCTLDEFILKYVLRYETDEEHNVLKGYAQEYETIRTTYTNTKILDWISDNLTDGRNSSDKFVLSIFGVSMEIDLCFQKEMIMLNDKLMNILLEDTTIKNFMYLFIKDSRKNDNVDVWDILTNTELTDKIHKDIDNCLVPLFTSPYINDFDINTVHTMISRKKINNSKYIFNDGKYFKEIDILKTAISESTLSKIDKLNKMIEDNGLDIQWYSYAVGIDELELANETFDRSDMDAVNKYIKAKIEFIYNENIDIFYDYVRSIGILLYSVYDIMNIMYDSIIDSIEGLTYDSDYNMYIYEHDGKTYGFYYIDFTIDNTNNSFNVLNDYNLLIHIDSIDDKPIKTYDAVYFDSIFPLLQPLLKKNVFIEFSKTISTIVYPYEAEIAIKYAMTKANEELTKQYSMLQDNEDDVLYSDIGLLSNEKKIKLLRYFNYITPYLKKTENIKNVWELKFMKHNNFEDIDKFSIFVKNDLSIYRYNGITAYDGIYDKRSLEFNQKEQLSQYEYKHFNDSVIFNLPESIYIADDKLYSLSYVNKLKDRNYLEETKKQILLKYFTKKKLEYRDIILFLYNKYDSSIFIEKSVLNTNKNEYKYKISYKFTLI